MSSSFYSPDGVLQEYIMKADGSEPRRVTMADAKKHGWWSRVSTIAGIVKADDFLTTWKINQYLDSAAGTSKLLARNHDLWKKEVRKIADDNMSIAPKLGTLVHATVEAYHKIKCQDGDLNDLNDTKPEALPYLVAIHQFCEEHAIRALSPADIEKRIVIPEARSAGTCDLIGSFEGTSPVLFDWKTQKVKGGKPYYYPSFPLQLAAYWAGNGGVGRICSVVIDTSGHAQYDVNSGRLPPIYYKMYDGVLTHYGHFLNLSKIYYYMHDWEEHKNGSSEGK